MFLKRRINGNRGLETAPTDDATTSAIASAYQEFLTYLAVERNCSPLTI